jgi:hypothetical protein
LNFNYDGAVIIEFQSESRENNLVLCEMTASCGAEYNSIFSHNIYDWYNNKSGLFFKFNIWTLYFILDLNLVFYLLKVCFYRLHKLISFVSFEVFTISIGHVSKCSCICQRMQIVCHMWQIDRKRSNWNLIVKDQIETFKT